MEKREKELWELAEARVGFKRHLRVYVIVNVLVWLLWFAIQSTTSFNSNVFLPWPTWITLGWGIGIFSHFMGVYVNKSSTAVNKEYEKLKKRER